MAFQRGARRTIEEKEWIIDFIDLAKLEGVRHHFACQCAGISSKTYYKWKSHTRDDKRKGPKIIKNRLSQEERQVVLDTLCSQEYCDLPISQVYIRLLDQGIYYCSESTMYRILKTENLNKSRTKTRNPKNKTKPVLKATQPNQVWTWDITYLKSDVKGSFFYLYLILDMFSRCIVGAKVYESENSEHAKELLEQAYRNENLIKNQIILHSDNGSPMKSANFQVKLQDLGVLPSFSRPRVCNDNPYSEAMFRTVKYNVMKPLKRGFSSVEDANQWLGEFIDWYNKEHYHSGIKYCKPEDRHRLKDQKILKNREIVLLNAKKQHKERWIGGTIRDWLYIDSVYINEEKFTSA